MPIPTEVAPALHRCKSWAETGECTSNPGYMVGDASNALCRGMARSITRNVTAVRCLPHFTGRVAVSSPATAVIWVPMSEWVGRQLLVSWKTAFSIMEVKGQRGEKCNVPQLET
eukprot:198016-Pelagomonas_calceolata.AAC.4